MYSVLEYRTCLNMLGMEMEMAMGPRRPRKGKHGAACRLTYRSCVLCAAICRALPFCQFRVVCLLSTRSPSSPSRVLHALPLSVPVRPSELRVQTLFRVP